MLLSRSKNFGTKIWLFVIVDATKKAFFLILFIAILPKEASVTFPWKTLVSSTFHTDGVILEYPVGPSQYD